MPSYLLQVAYTSEGWAAQVKSPQNRIEAVRLGVLDELLPAETFEATVMERAARLGAFPREAYAHTKAALVAEAVARIEAETPELVAEEIRACLKNRAEEGLPLTISTRSLSLA